jgi:hypothetical protein
VSGGFFGLAHAPALRFVLYAGAALVVLSTVAAGIGLLRATPRAALADGARGR